MKNREKYQKEWRLKNLEKSRKYKREWERAKRMRIKASLPRCKSCGQILKNK
jgi:hypothetical protein